MDFPVPLDDRMEIKESEKINKHLDFAREQKKLRNIKVTLIPTLIGALETVSERLEKSTRGIENPRQNREHSD